MPCDIDYRNISNDQQPLLQNAKTSNVCNADDINFYLHVEGVSSVLFYLELDHNKLQTRLSDT